MNHFACAVRAKKQRSDSGEHAVQQAFACAQFMRIGYTLKACVRAWKTEGRRWNGVTARRAMLIRRASGGASTLGGQNPKNPGDAFCQKRDRRLPAISACLLIHLPFVSVSRRRVLKERQIIGCTVSINWYRPQVF